ncbi:MAG: T9SS type A sorting domain-containing protein [Ignavibacteriales bacterium]|nr:T9SS type A sorting domain-containing protein [Ignavibacteriales bacterium]
MINKKLIVLILIIGLGSTIFSQSLFRSGRFFHHSTGNRIWGPNGSSTSIPNEMTLYNTEKGYIGNNEVSMNETWFPSDDNEWYTWHRIFDNSDPNDNIYPYLENNKIIVIKSCYPSSEMIGAGGPSDTLNNPSLKTIYNYKWHWRSIIQIMKQYPDNFFVIWTNAPLVPGATNIQEASLADQFCTWAKDTLATGNDPLLGEFPSNVYVFDFFHKLADATGMLQLQYATSTTDSHPNGLATELVSPQFVQEIFNAAIFYEGIIPVELTSFTISTNGPDVILRWSTATELNNFGFEIERKVGSGQSSVGNFEKIGFVNGQGTTTQKNEYSFADKNMVEGNYFYRLKQIDFGGNFEYSQIVEINWSSYTSYKLEQNYPNPFNPSTKIEFSIPVDGFVNLAVYNLLGEKVTQLLNSNFKAGAYEFIFDASSLSSGVYFYKIESGTFLKFKKMILSK